MTGMGMLLKNMGIDPEKIVADFGAVKTDIDAFKAEVLGRVQRIEDKIDTLISISAEAHRAETFNIAAIPHLVAQDSNTKAAGPNVVSDDPNIVAGRLDF